MNRVLMGLLSTTFIEELMMMMMMNIVNTFIFVFEVISNISSSLIYLNTFSNRRLLTNPFFKITCKLF